MSPTPPRLAVDIGGTFTDIAIEAGSRSWGRKVLTTPAAPERAVLEGVGQAVAEAGLAPAEFGLLIHGTTLATNAIIERKGARTALIVTEGFRDSVEMAYENRFEQYDIGIEKPEPLVARWLRWPVRERLSAKGDVLIPLDEASVLALVPRLRELEIESVAIGLIHSYANPAHERRCGELLAEACPGLSITLSSEVSPEIREYERLSTACANAYVQPLMAGYLGRLDQGLKEAGFRCPLLLMMSGGGLTTVETARRFPIRLVESGPAGGAILASGVAQACGLDAVLSFDMGGTTAKICLIDDGRPQTARVFEVDRRHRFAKGSGLPLRIPVIEMVEIGAGGGSIAQVDAMRRIAVGPESAGADPGPACYGRGGTRATVTDADLALGRIAPEGFAGGAVTLAPAAAGTALAEAVGRPLGLEGPLAAFAVSEVVDENMANAARVHAVERGKELGGRTLIAFGGAAPLHAARLAEKLGIDRVLVPAGAGVGSAIGFLRAPIAYEVVKSRYMRLAAFDHDGANRLLEEMAEEARAIVAQGAPGAALEESRLAYMRYVGQGHEIDVPVPAGRLVAADGGALMTAYEERYARLYGRAIPNMDVEILTWAVTVAAPSAPTQRVPDPPPAPAPLPIGRRQVFEPTAEAAIEFPVYARDQLVAGVRLSGPCLVAEAQTTTVVSPAFELRVDGLGDLILERRKDAS